MAIVISGVNNNDKITASDGTIDLLSGVNFNSELTVPSFKVGSNIQIGNAGIITATTLVGNVTGNINATSNLLLQIGGSEKFRVASSGQLGIGGANYGSSGQVLTSGGSGSAATWSAIPAQATIANNADNRVITGGSGVNLNGESGFTFDGSRASIINTSGSTLEVTTNTGSADATLRLSEGATGSTTNGGGMFYSGADNKLHITCGTNLTTKRITITRDAGLVGINTDSPSSAWLDIATDSGSYDHLRMRRLSSDSNIASNWSLKPYGGNLYFRTGGSTDKIYFDDSGDLNIMDGNLIMGTAGHGIDFSATSDGNGTDSSELLDDYEEGSFTPQFEGLSNTPAYAVRNGRYTKIGRYVHITGIIQSGGTNPTFTTTSDPLKITGLPYAGIGVIYFVSLGNVSHQSWQCFGNGQNEGNYQSGDIDFLNCQMEHNTSTMLFIMGKGGSSRAKVRNTACHNNGFIIMFELSYTTA